MNPYQCSARKFFEERNDVSVSEVNAAAGRGLADSGLIASAVNINIARVRIHVAAAIESRLKAIQPKDARGDFCIGNAFPCVADGLACFKHRPRRPAISDFFRDTMQAKRRAVRAFLLADAKTGSGAAEYFYQLIFTTGRRGFFEKRNGLIGDADGEHPWR